MDPFPEWIAWCLLAAFAVPFGIAACSLYPIRRYADRLGLLDHPGGHKSHTTVTPLGGGLGIWLGVMMTFAAGTATVGVLLSQPAWQARIPAEAAVNLEGAWSRVGPVWAVLGAGTLLVGLGLWDDRCGIHWSLRLGVQFLIASVVVYGLGFGFTLFLPISWLTELLSVIWIVAVINSFNMLDNMDGLSGGVAAIIAVAMATVLLSTPNPGMAEPQLFLGTLLLVVAGSLGGFLWHNRPPAKIFMGDGGSYFIGFLIAVTMLMATYTGGGVDPEGDWASSAGVARPHAVLAPLCAMAVPLYDMSTVLWIRIREGRSPFAGDRSHFSHRLVDLGMSRTGAVLTIYLLTGTCGLAAILLAHVTTLQALAVLGIVLCMLLLIMILESTAWRKKSG